MSTVRIQLRRGLAEDWVDVDPVLAAGEVGIESDTNKFKIGNNADSWTELSYANVTPTGLGDSLSDYVLLADVGQANGVASLDSDGLVPATQLPPLVKISVTQVADQTERLALSAQAGDIAIQNDNGTTYVLSSSPASVNVNWKALTASTEIANAVNTHNSNTTNVHGIADTSILATTNTSQTLTNKTISGINNTITIQTSDISNFTESSQDLMNSTIIAGTNLNTSYNDNAGTITINLSNDVTISGNFNANAIGANSLTVDGEIQAGSLIVDGDLTVNGTYNTVPVESLTVTNPMIYMAEGNVGNSVDIGLVGSHTISGTYSHTGFVKDATDGVWKLFTNITAEPTTTVDFSNYTKDTMQLGVLYADEAHIGSVSNEELSYLNGVSSAIQTQIDSKLASSDAFDTYAVKNNTTLTGTVTLPSTTSIGNVSGTEIGYLDGVTSAIQTQIDTKAPLSGPTFTGTVVLPSTTSIGNVSSTEISYLDGVTSAIQTQLNNKVTADDIATHAATNTNVHGIADTSQLATLTYVNTSLSTHENDTSAHGTTGNVVGTSDTQTLTNKTISYLNNTITVQAANISDITASASEINLLDGVTANTSEINILDGLTASTAELNILDGATLSTAELNYVDGVTSAIQTQINEKAPLASPTFTGTVTLPAGTITSGMILDGTIVDADINASAAIALSKLATDPLARANHTGTQDASTISNFDTQVRTSKVTDLTAPTGSFSMNSQKITNLADPTADQDAATKAYVDAATAGLNVHASVKAATTANITLATDVENGDTLDGVTLATGNRILVKNQTTKSQNGVYTVNASGAPTRATDYDSTPEVDAGDFIFVESGTVNGKTGWVQTNNVTTIGTDAIEFTQFSGSGTYAAGTGLTLTGNTFSINTDTTVDLNTAQTLTNKTINLGSNTVSGTTAQFNSALTDGDFATLAGSETLTNKTLTSPIMTTPTLGAATATSIAFSGDAAGITQSSAGVPSITPIIAATLTAGVYNLSTGGLTLRDDLIELDSTSAITLRIPTDATTNFPIGTSIDILQTNTGQVTIAAETPATTTVNGTPGLKLRTRWSSATLFKRAANSWVVMGDLSA